MHLEIKETQKKKFVCVFFLLSLILKAFNERKKRHAYSNQVFVSQKRVESMKIVETLSVL